MLEKSDKNVELLVVDTTAFIENAPLQNMGHHIITCQEVVDEITNKRQLRRLVVLPYDLEIKNVYPENIKIITDLSKKTGDYPSLSATDIKVMALTYQLEKEHVGIEHLRTEPVIQRTVNLISKKQNDLKADIAGFYNPNKNQQSTAEELNEKFEAINFKDDSLQEDVVDKVSVSVNEDCVTDEVDTDENKEDKVSVSVNEDCVTDEVDTDESKEDKVLVRVNEDCVTDEVYTDESKEDSDDFEEDDDDAGWITPANIQKAKSQINSELMEEKSVKVACITTDFAMQNVLKQMNLNVVALDGRVIKQIKTFILRCYTCFGTTSIMTKLFCPKCGNKTLKRVTVSLDEHGKQQIHINPRHPLTARGKKFSLPKIKGGKHSNNPILVEDQPVPDQRPTRLARTKNNPLDDDYIAGFSPFVMRDVTSKSAQLKIRPGADIKHWMRRNPNEKCVRKK